MLASQCKCVLCSKDHYLNQCPNFQGFNLKERNDFVVKNELCRNCLHKGHVARECRRVSLCRKCPSKHNEMLHDPEFKAKSSESVLVHSSEFSASQSASNKVGIACVEVCVEGKDALIRCKAIVDR